MRARKADRIRRLAISGIREGIRANVQDVVVSVGPYSCNRSADGQGAEARGDA